MKGSNRVSEITSESDDCYCKECGTPLPITHTGPCPKCGKTGKIIKKEFTDGFTLTDHITRKSRKEFFDENPLIKWLIHILSFGSPFLGYFLQKEIGVLIGLFISFISYLLVPYAVIKIREIIQESS